jgi:hypothetical protein
MCIHGELSCVVLDGLGRVRSEGSGSQHFPGDDEVLEGLVGFLHVTTPLVANVLLRGPTVRPSECLCHDVTAGRITKYGHDALGFQWSGASVHTWTRSIYSRRLWLVAGHTVHRPTLQWKVEGTWSYNVQGSTRLSAEDTGRRAPLNPGDATRPALGTEIG